MRREKRHDSLRSMMESQNWQHNSTAGSSPATADGQLNSLGEAFPQLLASTCIPGFYSRPRQLQHPRGLVRLPLLQSQQPHDDSRSAVKAINRISQDTPFFCFCVKDVRMEGIPGARNFARLRSLLRNIVIGQIAILGLSLPYFRQRLVDDDPKKPAGELRLALELLDM